METVEWDPWCVKTLRHNRPTWRIFDRDVKSYRPHTRTRPDILVAGPPCQGFSLGGNRREHDFRNSLYKEVLRLADLVKPRVVLIENVLNVRVMRSPVTGVAFLQANGSGVEWIRLPNIQLNIPCMPVRCASNPTAVRPCRLPKNCPTS